MSQSPYEQLEQEMKKFGIPMPTRTFEPFDELHGNFSGRNGRSDEQLIAIRRHDLAGFVRFFGDLIARLNAFPEFRHPLAQEDLNLLAKCRRFLHEERAILEGKRYG